MHAAFADRTEMQHRLFAELSAMFAGPREIGRAHV